MELQTTLERKCKDMKLEDLIPRPNICDYCNTQVEWVTQLEGKPICLECWNRLHLIRGVLE